MMERPIPVFLFMLLLVFPSGILAQVTASHNNNLGDEFHLIDKAFEKKDWLEVARLQKKAYFIDKNPSRLLWSARCYAWLNDTEKALKYADTAVRCGYTNIYIMDHDTSFDALRDKMMWKVIRAQAEKKYLSNEAVFYWGYYYGLIGLILVLNIFLFFSTREWSYLYLVLMLLADMHLEMFNNSSLKIYITKLVPWVAQAVATRFPPPTLYSGLLVLCFLFFSKTFLKVRKTLPKLVPVFYAFIFFFVFVIVVRLQWGLLPDLLIQIAVSAAFLFCLTAGVIQFRKGVSEARHFVLAAVFITLGILGNDMIHIYVFSAINIGFVLAFTTLTIGIGAKVKIMQLEKERAQEKAMELLEEKVKERTAEVVQQKNEIAEQKFLVEEKQKEILDSILYAKRLQHATLPPREFIDQHLENNFVLYKPKDIVAGDFYWAEGIRLKNSPGENFSEEPASGEADLFFIAAADSTGHGVPGALVSVVCSGALNRAVNEFGLYDTGKILDKVKELVVETFVRKDSYGEKSNAEVKDGMDISLLCLDFKHKKISWSGANNPLWYIQDQKLQEIQPDKQPIGKTDNSLPFTRHEISYKENTTFYLFTDGYADQFGGPKAKKFKYKQFEELLFSINNKPMKEQANVINQAFESWKGQLEQVDDVCVIGIKI